MMAVDTIVQLSVTKRFSRWWKYFVQLTDDSEEFDAYMKENMKNKDGTLSKNLKNGKNACRIRFAIEKCSRQMNADNKRRKRKDIN